MNSPKEKAISLVEKFNFICHIDSYGFTDYYETKHNREQCAIIAVDEIINICQFDDLRYWQQVKRELQML